MSNNRVMRTILQLPPIGAAFLFMPPYLLWHSTTSALGPGVSGVTAVKQCFPEAVGVGRGARRREEGWMKAPLRCSLSGLAAVQGGGPGKGGRAQSPTSH